MDGLWRACGRESFKAHRLASDIVVALVVPQDGARSTSGTMLVSSMPSRSIGPSKSVKASAGFSAGLAAAAAALAFFFAAFLSTIAIGCAGSSLVISSLILTCARINP